MIVRERVNWFRMLFVWHGSVMSKILPRILLLIFLSILIYSFHGSIFNKKIPLNSEAFTLVGIALAIFLGFCNTAAYDRYWEGRKLWGSLVIDSRSIARKTISFVEDGKEQEDKTEYFVKLCIAFGYTLKHQLRKTDPKADIDELLPVQAAFSINAAQFKPVMILKLMAEWLQRAEKQGRTDSITKMGIDKNLDHLSAMIGGCERIANTPIPFPYHVLLHRTVYIYCFLLPFGLVDSIGWMTPIMVTFIGYTFIALDAIVEEISDPFGTEPNDLPLNALCTSIEKSLSELASIQQRAIREQSGNIQD